MGNMDLWGRSHWKGGVRPQRSLPDLRNANQVAAAHAGVFLTWEIRNRRLHYFILCLNVKGCPAHGQIKPATPMQSALTHPERLQFILVLEVSFLQKFVLVPTLGTWVHFVHWEERIVCGLKAGTPEDDVGDITYYHHALVFSSTKQHWQYLSSCSAVCGMRQTITWESLLVLEKGLSRTFRMRVICQMTHWWENTLRTVFLYCLFNICRKNLVNGNNTL